MKSRHKYVAGSQDEGLRRRGNSRDRRESEENRKRGSQGYSSFLLMSVGGVLDSLVLIVLCICLPLVMLLIWIQE